MLTKNNDQTPSIMKLEAMQDVRYTRPVDFGTETMGRQKILDTKRPRFEQQTWSIITDLEAMLEVVYFVDKKQVASSLGPISIMGLLLSSLDQSLMPNNGQLPSLAALAVLKEIENGARFKSGMN